MGVKWRTYKWVIRSQAPYLEREGEGSETK